MDISIPSWTDTIGASELGTAWNDPEFDSSPEVFYYARVIEIPTPRWTACDRVEFGLDGPDDRQSAVRDVPAAATAAGND